jgi:hypothetical protein
MLKMQGHPSHGIQLAECGFRNKLKVSLFEIILFYSRIFIFILKISYEHVL